MRSCEMTPGDLVVRETDPDGDIYLVVGWSSGQWNAYPLLLCSDGIVYPALGVLWKAVTTRGP